MPEVGDYIREARFKPPPTYPHGAYFGLPRRRRNGAEGRPIPQPLVRTYEGRRALLDDILGEDSRSSATPAIRAQARREDARRVSPRSALGSCRSTPLASVPRATPSRADPSAGGVVEVEDLTGEGVAWFRSVGAKKGSVAVIRPDKFVYALAPASGAADIVTHALRAMKADRAPTVNAPEIRLRTAA